MCRFFNVWVRIFVGFVICVFDVCVAFLMCGFLCVGFSNVFLCVCVAF